MNISTIKVKKLFGLFDHTIQINKDSNITILIGENGLGKTILLESIEALFSYKFIFLKQIVFREIEIEFEDSTIWKIKKHNEKEGNRIELIEKTKNKLKDNRFDLFAKESDEEFLFYKNLQKKFLDDNDEKFTPNDIELNYLISKQLLYKKGKRNNYDVQGNCPDWIKERISNNKVGLIETQRLISVNKDSSKYSENIVSQSKSLAKKIQNQLSLSTANSSNLDRTFPDRLIKKVQDTVNSISFLELQKKLEKLETQRAKLDKVGLIGLDKGITITNLEQINDVNQNVLGEVLDLYADDSFEKNEIFNDLAIKIDLFLEIINRRFRHKKLAVDKELGFLVYSSILKDNNENPINIPLEKLSSGEKNEILLFYRLIFETESNSLILIDEPEVSLHISWQNSFIDDLKQIIDVNPIKVLIATHSPDIIGDNWDLKIELKGIE